MHKFVILIYFAPYFVLHNISKPKWPETHVLLRTIAVHLDIDFDLQNLAYIHKQLIGCRQKEINFIDFVGGLIRN